jgi:hypothetical protein
MRDVRHLVTAFGLLYGGDDLLFAISFLGHAFLVFGVSLEDCAAQDYSSFGW